MKVPTYQRKTGAPSALPNVALGSRPYLPNAPGPEAFGAGLGRVLSQTGSQLERVAERMQAEEDATRIVDAQNQLASWERGFFNDPEKGIFSRKNKDAVGLYGEASKTYEEKLREISAGLENDRQRMRFTSMASNSMNTKLDAVARYEAVQRQSWMTATAKQAMEGRMSDIAANYSDENIVSAAIGDVRASIETMFPGMGQDFIAQATKDFVSAAQIARIDAALEADNPDLAGKIYEAHEEEIDGVHRSSLKAKIDSIASVYEVQRTVDQMVKRYGPEQEKEGLSWIRENKSGMEEEKVVSAYRQRINELSIASRSQQVSLGDVQKNNFDSLYVNTFAKGMAPDPGVVDKMLATGQISPAQHRQIVGWVSSTGGRSRAEDYLSRNDPEWDYLTPDERDHRALVHMGRSSDELKQAATQARSGVMDGSVDEARLNDLFHNGWITASEFSKNKKLLSQINDEQKAFRSQQQELLKDDLKALKSDLFKKYGPVAKKIYDEKTVTIDFSSPSAREELVEARMETLAEVVELSGKALEESSFIRLGKVVSTDLGERFTTVQEAAKDELEAAKSYDPFGVKEERQKVEERAEAEALDKVFGDTPLFLFP